MKRSVFAAVALGVAFSAAAMAAPAGTTTTGDDAMQAAKPADAKPAQKPVAKAKTKTPAVTGTVWAGTINQVGRDAPYALQITLLAKGGGTTSYPDQHCAGKLTRVGAAGDYTFFTEAITDGKFDPASKAGCLDGSLTLHKDGASLVMTWMTSYNGKAIVAYGALNPATPTQ